VYVSVCLCVGHANELSKTAEPIEMPFAKLNHVGTKNHGLDGDPGPPHGRGPYEIPCTDIYRTLKAPLVTSGLQSQNIPAIEGDMCQLLQFTYA